jgi:outer membrane protein
MNSKILAAGLTGLLACAPVSADMLFGLYVKAGGWSQSPSGEFGDNHANMFDLETDLGMDSETGSMVSIAVEHFVPLIPNIKVERTDLSFTSAGTMSKTVIFDNVTFVTGTTVTSDIDLSHTDFILYYEILDNWVSLDIGLNVKVFDGELAVTHSVAGTGKTDLSDTVPMLYGKAQFDLPFSGLSAGAEGSYIGYDGDSFTDLRGYIGYEFMFGLGIELGVRNISLKFDDLDDAVIDTTFEGGYLSATFHL